MHLTEETAKRLLETQEAMLRELERFNQNSPFILTMLKKETASQGRKQMLQQAKRIGDKQLDKFLHRKPDNL